MAILFFYNAHSGAATIGRLQGHAFATTHQIPAAFSWWTHFGQSGNSVFLYNMTSGSGVLCEITETTFTTKNNLPGAFSTAWTHVVRQQDVLLFYNAARGSGALARVVGDAIVTVKNYEKGAFSAGWSHIAATDQAFFFYNVMNGAGAVAIVSGDSLVTVKQYEAGQFTTLWSHIVASGNRVLFYNHLDGSAAIGALENGQLVTVAQLAAGQLTTAWTNVVGTTDGLLFYNAEDGSGAVAHINGAAFITDYRLEAGQFTTGWTDVIGSSFSRLKLPWRTLQAVAWPLSVRPGEEIGFRVSTGASSYRVTYTKFRNNTGPMTEGDIDNNRELVEEALVEPFDVEGAWQYTDFYPAEGCVQWRDSFSLTIPDGWKSGIYAARLEDSAGGVYYAPFVVNPPRGSAAQLLMLANTNTWTAYNYWGAYSRYETRQSGPWELSVLRPNFRLFGKNTIADQYHSRHLVRAELWVLNWLTENGYAVDVYTDLDFHDGIDDLDSYAAIILACHPEYWSLHMMANLKAYLHGGCRLICLSANDLYDAVDISENFQTITVYGQYGTGRERLFQQPTINQPEYEVMGIGFHWDGDDTGNAINSRRPYQIVDDQHRFFTGTGLSAGDFVGQYGWSYDVGRPGGDGSACGWEVDAPYDSSPPLQVLAVGSNRADGCAYDGHLVYHEPGGGGWVLAVGSMSFAGSLSVDAKLQRLVRNALDDALGS
jgi:hypothetical protein